MGKENFWPPASKNGYVTSYEIDNEEMKKLHILQFHAPDIEWLRFVVKNRLGENTSSDWDIISGP